MKIQIRYVVMNSILQYTNESNMLGLGLSYPQICSTSKEKCLQVGKHF